MQEKSPTILIYEAHQEIQQRCALLLAQNNMNLILATDHKDEIKDLIEKCQENGVTVQCVSIDFKMSEKQNEVISVNDEIFKKQFMEPSSFHQIEKRQSANHQYRKKLK